MPNSISDIELAEKAYKAFGATTNFKNLQGEEMPSFENLPDLIKRAWVEAALTAYYWATMKERG